MPPSNLLAPTGMLFRSASDRPPTFLGTCFALVGPATIMTAAHCVKGIPKQDLSLVVYPDAGLEKGLPVEAVRLHPGADIAVLTVPSADGILEPYSFVTNDIGPGSDVTALGYPSQSTATGIEPTPRLLRGFVQRTFEHESHLGFKYVADELSFGAPGGLSGGPLLSSRNQVSVAGIVCENLQASTYLYSMSEVKDGNEHYSETVHNVINYGIALRLWYHLDWLQESIPALVPL